MKIGVISDTHIPSRARALPRVIFDLFDGVDLILHAGDITAGAVLTELSALAPVEAVAGNMDGHDLRARLGVSRLLRLQGMTIGLVHGAASSGTTVRYALQTFIAEQPHCIVFGHTHQPYNKRIGATLMFNPGSATDPRRAGAPSCGFLYLEEGTARGEIVRLEAGVPG